MGLDIAAYETATLTPEHEYDSEACYEGNHVEAFVYSGFERSMRGLEGGVSGKSGWERPSRCYVVSGASLDFRAGSYSGYGQFRRALSTAALGVEPEAVWADPDAYADLPFFELVNFADNEGTIGPEAAADLAGDFAEHRERVCPALGDGPNGDYYREKYDEWAAAFALAADSGLVEFR